MRGRRLVVTVALVSAVAAAVPALAADGGAVPAAVVDRSVTAVQWGAAAECRRVAPDDEQCGPIDGRPVSAARIAAYQRSWVHRALALQSTLDDRAPLTEALLPHTHNSFNSSAYGPTLTNQDANQPYSLTDQLEMDIRAIELDVHWVPSAYGNAATGGYWPTLCHGKTQGPVHVGCSVDRPLQDGLAEVAAWMRAHPSAFVLLYLENQLGDSVQAHEVAGALVQQYLGALALPLPAASPCQAMDWSLSQRAIEATGRRLVIVGNCATSVAGATPWGALVHERGPVWDENGDPSTYADPGSTQCADDRARAGRRFRRYFEDSTWIAAAVGSNPATSSLGGTSTISAASTALMVRCGVNLVGFDQLTPEDPRLAALVWSWAPDEPAVGASGCAYQGADTRWRLDGDCRTKRVAACVSASGAWSVTSKAVTWDRAARECAASAVAGSTFGAPPNGYRNTLLAAAARSADVWVNVRL